MNLRVGIFFGGPSREREISFAGGRTVYDNLNQRLFTPVPIFVDSFRNWVLLNWQYVYKGSIRDFYPPVSALPPSANDFRIYAESIAGLDAAAQAKLLGQIGTVIPPEQIGEHIDLAFLALHSEDGQLQQQLEDLGIAYTGSSVRASQIGMDRVLQKELMATKGFACPKAQVITREAWLKGSVGDFYEKAVTDIKWPLVIRPAKQGSSIGVSIIQEEVGLAGFEKAVENAFFREIIPVHEWQVRSPFERVEYVKRVADI
ncbi:MAG: D-alanine--D-alanine ligase, partial [Bacteroidota bacterium]